MSTQREQEHRRIAEQLAMKSVNLLRAPKDKQILSTYLESYNYFYSTLEELNDDANKIQNFISTNPR